jgi:hypothetical protein
VSPRLVDVPGGWELPLAGATVTQVSVDHAFALLLAPASGGGGAFTCTVESPFVLGGATFTPGAEDPTTLGRALVVLHRTVVGAVHASECGTLTIVLSGDLTLSVAPSDAYEAWNITGPDGFRVVAMPGGDLAIWDRCEP